MTAWSPLAHVADAIRERAARVRLACFDVDGVMTDGGLYYSDAGHETKRYHVHDGLGLKMLMDSGVAVAVITARNTPSVTRRMADLGIAQVFLGERDKLARVRALAAERALSLDEIAFCGDDLPDYSAMRQVGFAVTVPNAHALARSVAHWQTVQPGGAGAVRELCDLIIAAQGRMDAAIARFAP